MTNADEAYKLLTVGQKNLKIACTKLNHSSSRRFGQKELQLLHHIKIFRGYNILIMLHVVMATLIDRKVIERIVAYVQQ